MHPEPSCVSRVGRNHVNVIQVHQIPTMLLGLKTSELQIFIIQDCVYVHKRLQKVGVSNTSAWFNMESCQRGGVAPSPGLPPVVVMFSLTV